MPTGIYLRVKPMSEEAKNKIRLSKLGKKLSEKHKQSLRLAKIGYMPKTAGWHKGQSGERMPGFRDGIRTFRKIVESFIGRQLLSREVVHHIDRDRRNNKISNLYIFRHHNAHKRWHHFLKRHNLSDTILESNLFYLKTL